MNNKVQIRKNNPMAFIMLSLSDLLLFLFFDITLTKETSSLIYQTSNPI